MVTTITNFGRSGLYDWLLQRISAVVLALYSVFMVVYLLLNPQLDYAQWDALMALLSLGAHCWIGLWSVSTDYIKPFVFRFVFQMVIGVLMFVYTVWGVQLLWGL